MTNARNRSDDRPVRGRGWKYMAGLVAAGLGAGMAVVGLNPGATRLGDVFSDANAGIVTGIGIGLFVVGLMIAWKLRPGGPASRGEDEPGKRERMQAQRSMLLWLFPIVTLIFLYQSTRAIPLILAGDDAVSNYMSVLLPVLYAWLAASVTMGWDGNSRKNRRYLEDELTQVLRARAIVWAFLVLMSGTTIALGLGLWRLELGLVALPFALAAAGATAGLRFAWLDREAGRDDG
ncbi:hypothetical protein [Brevundimonas sp.]|uniref:hypothetical protein n=1 Tax=Brevundimonas sp. TaxID=1871086 RepID=UPI002617358F|nr:hypothetical protein [Brevundimonas sp.]